MAKKEKIQIQRDKRMEPIDNELDAALGLLEDRNRQIAELLASFAPPETPPVEEGAPADAEAKAEDAKPAEEGEAGAEAE